jgi:hypothetical protein
MSQTTKDEYLRYRNRLLNNPDEIRREEKEQSRFLLERILESAEEIEKDFNQASELRRFWTNNPPSNRGAAPKGDKVPWSEVGETTITPNVVKSVQRGAPGVEFPGLPSGADTRFLLNGQIVHFDVKATGPTDRTDEVVASPNQVSGDGSIWKDQGVDNSPFDVYGPQGGHTPFKPELSPAYKINGEWGMCVTVFLKAVYTVESRGVQPLDYLELASVPNGLMLFDGPTYAEKLDRLLTPGKDRKSKSNPRTRVKLDPLSRIAPWRSVKIYKQGGTWKHESRDGSTGNLFL